MRKGIITKDYLVDTLVESSQNFYHQCDGLSFVDEDEFGSKKWFIGFKQPLQFLYHTGGNQKPDDLLLRQTQYQGGS